MTQNAHVRSGITMGTVRWAFTAGTAGNWHPITWLSHALDWQLFGDDSRGHHAVNILWHAFNAVLAFVTLCRLTNAFWTSAVSAALFAWHPLRVESVAWIAERKDVLCTFFGLLALWAFALFAQASERQKAKAKIYYWLALVAFAFGLLSKPMLVTLPFVFLLLDQWPLKRFSARTIREKIPFFLLSTAAAVVTYRVQKTSGAMAQTSTIGNGLANAAVAVADYLRDFFWPFDLAVAYPRPDHWPAAKLAAAILIVFVVTAVGLWRRHRQPFISIGWFLFIGMLVPVIGIVQVGMQARADRYTYLPVLGLQLALLWTLRDVVSSVSLRRVATAITVLVLAICASRTWEQQMVWQNSRTLYEHSLFVTKDNYLAHSYLGAVLFNEDRLNEARDSFKRAIEIKPDYAPAHDRLGLVFEKLGYPLEALPHYERAVTILPNDALMHLHFATALAALDRDAEALVHYQKTLELKPNLALAHRYYADSLRALKRFYEACEQYRQALKQQPDDFEAYFGLGVTLEELTRFDEALACYLEAIKLNPAFPDAQYNAGVILMNNNQPIKAIPHFRAVVKSNPQYTSALIGLGLAAERLNQPHDAVVYYEQALQLQPDLSEIAERLANARRQETDKTPSK